MKPAFPSANLTPNIQPKQQSMNSTTCECLTTRQRKAGLRCAALILCSLLLHACGRNEPAPVYQRNAPQKQTISNPVPHATDTKDSYVVSRGDTLYSISWKYNLDYSQLAQWNGISPPYTIYVGQRLRVAVTAQTPASKMQAPAPALIPKQLPPLATKAPASLPKAPVDLVPTLEEPTPMPRESTPALEEPTPAQSPTKPTEQADLCGQNQSFKYLQRYSSPRLLSWKWPTKGKTIKVNTPVGKKGMTISGEHGQIIRAVESGQVVFCGNLEGYGKMIIIKHSKDFLSAYAYNSEILVNQGDEVQAGQQITKMGYAPPENNPVLHLEIRKNGVPINPKRLLPK
ncbi:MAG: peptidoglycan DD-metalloendopeptidase family protein [Candidatus Eutrophobiaceae bacterium]